MSQTKVKSGLISDQSITASKLDVTGNGTSGQVLLSDGDGSFSWGDVSVDVNGVGTTNYISKWLDSDTIGNSVIYDNGTNVGIGTNNPIVPLTLYGTMRIKDGGASTGTKIGYDNSSSANFQIYNYQTGNIEFATAGTERMRIDSSGKLLINTTNTSASGLFRVRQSAGFNLSTFTDGTGVGFAATNDDVSTNVNFVIQGAEVYFKTLGAVERMRIDSAGNVGIGTSSITTSRLQIKGGSNVTTAYYDGLKVTSNNETVYTQYNWNGINGSSTLLFATADTERMRITSTGNVGIGTTIPSTPLVISKNSPASGTMLILQNTLYGSTNSSGLNSIEFGWLNHTAAKISANKESVNRTGFIITGEVGYNVPIEIARFTSFGDLHVNQDVIAYSTTISDERLKDNIVTIDNALDKVCELRGVEYDWNASSRSGQHDMGVIAQEVEKVFPFIVREKEMPLVDGNTYKTVDYEKLVGVLIEAVKELKQEIEILKSK